MMYKKKKNKRKKQVYIFLYGFIFIIFLFLIMSKSRTKNLEISQDGEKEIYLIESQELAVKVSKKYRLFPSVTLAQSALESNFGRSELSNKYNNYFGIKSNNKESARLTTTEYINGEKKSLKEPFRVYNSKEESFVDYALLLTRAKRYKNVKKSKDYKEAAKIIQESGYATDPSYSEKIINIIEYYKLYELDENLLN